MIRLKDFLEKLDVDVNSVIIRVYIGAMAFDNEYSDDKFEFVPHCLVVNNAIVSKDSVIIETLIDE